MLANFLNPGAFDHAQVIGTVRPEDCGNIYYFGTFDHALGDVVDFESTHQGPCSPAQNLTRAPGLYKSLMAPPEPQGITRATGFHSYAGAPPEPQGSACAQGLHTSPRAQPESQGFTRAPRFHPSSKRDLWPHPSPWIAFVPNTSTRA